MPDWKTLFGVGGNREDALRRRQIEETAGAGKGRVYGDIYLSSAKDKAESMQKGAAAVKGLQDFGKRMQK